MQEGMAERGDLIGGKVQAVRWRPFEGDNKGGENIGVGLREELERVVDVMVEESRGRLKWTEHQRKQVAREAAWKTLARRHNGRWEPVEPDGNCQFGAVARGATGDAKHADCLRRLLTQLIQAEVEDLDQREAELTIEDEVRRALLIEDRAAVRKVGRTVDGVTMGLLAMHMGIQLEWVF